MKRTLFTLLVALAVLFGVAYVVGAKLPAEHTVARSAVYDRPIRDVWAAISDYAAIPKWSREIATTQQQDNSATGNPVWKFTDKHGGYMVLETTETVRHEKLVSQIVESSYPFGGTWTFVLAPEGNGTRLTLTENGEVYNPLLRFASHYIVGYNRGVDAFLNSLAAHFEQHVTIE